MFDQFGDWELIEGLDITVVQRLYPLLTKDGDTTPNWVWRWTGLGRRVPPGLGPALEQRPMGPAHHDQ